MATIAQPNTTAGAAIYMPILLRYIYDPVVLGFYCPKAWRITSRRIPGPPSNKAEALTRLRHLLAPGGTIFGMTILGRGVKHNLMGKHLMFWHNLLGVFGNTEDDVEGFVGPLMDVFEDVRWEVCGTMLLFEASKPRAQTLDTATSIHLS